MNCNRIVVPLGIPPPLITGTIHKTFYTKTRLVKRNNFDSSKAPVFIYMYLLHFNNTAIYLQKLKLISLYALIHYTCTWTFDVAVFYTHHFCPVLLSYPRHPCPWGSASGSVGRFSARRRQWTHCCLCQTNWRQTWYLKQPEMIFTLFYIEVSL